jgi:hypothetical protein
MPDISLTFTITAAQKAKLDRWFARWNPNNPVPFNSLEDALRQVLIDNVKNFLSEENLLKTPFLGEAMVAAPDDIQDAVLDALGPYLP